MRVELPTVVVAKPIVQRAKPRKIRAGSLLRGLVGRSVHPKHLWQAIKLHRGRKRHKRSSNDAQLALYAKMFPTGFLHYGYFDDPDHRPEDVSLADIESAQLRYAELLLELIEDRDEPVLDIGCGMGGLSRLLVKQGYDTTALTPDQTQVTHIQNILPDIPVIHGKFEDLPTKAHAARYGTLITAESLQYLKLDVALPLLTRLIKPGGSWIACDYFRLQPEGSKTGHVWDDFVKRITDNGWRITYERDVTPHILPTLRYIEMMTSRFGVPLMDYGVQRLQRKQPGLHHLVRNVLTDIENVIDDNVALIDPAVFTANKRYMLLKMQRSES